jgi:quinol monooxygenase YgiN
VTEATAPLVVTAVFTPADGCHDRVVDALRPAIAAVHRETGCVLYAIHDAPDGTIVMIEKWLSAQLLDQHGAGSAVAELNRSLDGLLARPVEVTRLVPIAAGDPERGSL